MNFDTEKFITEIQNRPSIWNKKCSDYSNRDVKQREWEEIVDVYGAELSSDEKKSLGGSLQKKWRNIRDCFVKAYKAKETKSGSAAKKKIPYIFYDNLLFLRDIVSVDSTTSNDTIDTEIKVENEVEEAQNIAIHSSDSSRAPKNNKRNKNDDVGREVIGILNRSLEKKNDEDDEDRLFFLSLVKEFKKIPEHVRIQTKMDILKVIQDAQYADNPNCQQRIQRPPRSTKKVRLH